MASIVVLVRHGKAQARDAERDDFTRNLTAAGRRALVATLPDALAPLGTMPEYLTGTTEIWSSDAHRAMESAEEVAFVLGISEIHSHTCLWEQNLDRFFEEVAGSPADVVVAVGHNPFIEEAASKLCGGAVPFKTGALGIFDVRGFDGTAYDGNLRSFSQGPRTDCWKTLVKMERTLANGAKKVQTNMDAFLENPEDVEALHDFRVSIRTLRSELAFIEPFQKKAQNKHLQKRLRNLVVTTSRLRELDVLAETVSTSRYANEEVNELCASMRDKEAQKLVSTIGTKKVRRDTRKLLKRFRDIEWREDVERFGLSSDEVASCFDQMVIAFEADYLETDYHDVIATHALRKKAKRVRYTAREFANVIGDAAEGMPDAMTKVQDELGALCDARVNCDLIDSMPRKKLSDEADLAVAAIKQEQLDRAAAILAASEAAEEEPSGIAAEDDVMFAEPEELLEEAGGTEEPAQESEVDVNFAEPEELLDETKDIEEPAQEENTVDISFDEPEAFTEEGADSE